MEIAEQFSQARQDDSPCHGRQQGSGMDFQPPETRNAKQEEEAD